MSESVMAKSIISPVDRLEKKTKSLKHGLFQVDISARYMLRVVKYALAVCVIMLVSTEPLTAYAQWQEPELIWKDASDQHDETKIASNEAGLMILVWGQHDGTKYVLKAKRYAPGTGWEPQETIDMCHDWRFNHYSVVMDRSGAAVVAYSKKEDGHWHALASRFEPGIGWSKPEFLEEHETRGAFAPSLAADKMGNTMAVWSQSDGNELSIWSNMYIAGAGWTGAELVEQNNTGHASNPKVVMYGTGKAVAVWEQSDGRRQAVWASRFLPASGWGLASVGDTDSSGSAKASQVVVDPEGNAIVVWAPWDGETYSVWANQFGSASGWGVPEPIEANPGSRTSLHPKVVVDSFGNATVVWQESLDDMRTDIWANRFESGRRWLGTELIEHIDPAPSLFQDVAVDPNGHVVAIWTQKSDGHVNLWSNTYKPGAGWQAQNLVENLEAGDAGSAVLAMDSYGRAIAAWRHYFVNFHEYYAAQYMPTGPLPSLVANGSGGPVFVDNDMPLSIDAKLLAGGQAGNMVDYFILAKMPQKALGEQIYSYSPWDGWLPGLRSSYTGKCRDIDSYRILHKPSHKGMPSGRYVLFFGVDLIPNGRFDAGHMYHDILPVTITE